MMSNGAAGLRAVKGEDDVLYIVGANEDAVTEPDDDGYVRGGYRVVKAGKRKVVGDDGTEREEDVVEIRTRAAGGSAATRIKGAPSAFVPPVKRDERLQVCRKLWKEDALAGNIVETTCDFTLGRGFEIMSEGLPKKVVSKFFKRNKGMQKASLLCNEGVVYGDNFVRLTVFLDDVQHPSNVKRFLWRKGQVRMTIIPPQTVLEIEHDPLDVNERVGYTLEYKGEKKAGSTDDRVDEKIELPDISRFDPEKHRDGGANGATASCIVYLKFNALSQDVFGNSDILRVKEWLENYADFLRDSVVINKLYRSPCYDITVKDADDREVRRAIRQYQDWEIGMNPVHNDREEWKVLEFTGANVSQESSRRALLLVIAAGVNMPEYMLADGANANLASAKAQQLPAIKKFEKRQEDYRWLWREIFTFVLDMAQQVGEVSGLEPELDFEDDPYWPVDVRFQPLIVERDKDIAEANRIGITDGWLSPQTAAARAGVNYNDERELRLESAKDALIDEVELEAFRESEDFKAIKAELGLPNETIPGGTQPPQPPQPAPAPQGQGGGSQGGQGGTQGDVNLPVDVTGPGGAGGA